MEAKIYHIHALFKKYNVPREIWYIFSMCRNARKLNYIITNFAHKSLSSSYATYASWKPVRVAKVYRL